MRTAPRHVRTARDGALPLSPDRDEAAIVSSPEILADEMADATKRLRERAWMISPFTLRADSAVVAGCTRTDAAVRSA